MPCATAPCAHTDLALLSNYITFSIVLFFLDCCFCLHISSPTIFKKHLFIYFALACACKGTKAEVVFIPSFLILLQTNIREDVSKAGWQKH